MEVKVKSEYYIGVDPGFGSGVFYYALPKIEIVGIVDEQVESDKEKDRLAGLEEAVAMAMVGK